MVSFQFRSVTPHALLAPYVSKIHLFESSGRLPAQDVKLIVPNANLKLTLTWRNGIVAEVGGKTFVQQENQLTLTGLIDAPVMLDPYADVQTGTIIFELNQLGGYRLFRLPYSELMNQIIDLTDLAGRRARQLQSQLCDTEDVNRKLQLMQEYLLVQLEQTAPDQIYDYCIDRIDASQGMVTVAQLEKETGYSARWLHKKFTEHLGTGPKNLAEIVRFKQFYQVYSTGADVQQLKQYIYHYYHDQSHFIRAFKRFTGFTPTDLQKNINELAARHYTS